VTHGNENWSAGMTTTRLRAVPVALAAFLALAMTPIPSPADPPPWAPAHGWRKKHDPYYVGYSGKRWANDYGVVSGRCNTEAVGAVLGGAVGGVVGSQVGKGEGRAVAVVLGTVIGAMVGAKVGRDIDERDRACMGHALELAGEKQAVAWTNEATGVAYQVTPQRGYAHNGVPCRVVTTLVTARGRTETITATACRRAEGEWEFRS
jgi:surface antigen